MESPASTGLESWTSTGGGVGASHTVMNKTIPPFNPQLVNTFTEANSNVTKVRLLLNSSGPLDQAGLHNNQVAEEKETVPKLG